MPSMAILFADVCGSTKIYERHGDERARKMIGRCIKLMTDATAEHGGVLIKTIGDEVMCRFPIPFLEIEAHRFLPPFVGIYRQKRR